MTVVYFVTPVGRITEKDMDTFAKAFSHGMSRPSGAAASSSRRSRRALVCGPCEELQHPVTRQEAVVALHHAAIGIEKEYRRNPLDPVT